LEGILLKDIIAIEIHVVLGKLVELVHVGHCLVHGVLVERVRGVEMHVVLEKRIRAGEVEGENRAN
jgi:hypothetical protein